MHSYQILQVSLVMLKKSPTIMKMIKFNKDISISLWSAIQKC